MRLVIRTVLFAAALLGGCATLVPAPRVARDMDPAAALADWGRVLRRFVDDRGRVDFAGLAADREEIDRYVAFVAATPAERFESGAPRLAHYVNAYNALSMYNVLESGIPATHAGFNKVRFFVLREHMIGGQRRSLYAFENDVIRPLGDPRVHFALNCSAVSCPRLPQVPFTAERLDAELDSEARRFFAESRNLRVDHAARTVWMSSILRFYQADFVPAHASDLIAYANRYAPDSVPGSYAVRFTPYDWTVANQAEPRTR